MVGSGLDRKEKEVWNEITHREGIGDFGGTEKMAINIDKVIKQQNFVQRKQYWFQSLRDFRKCILCCDHGNELVKVTCE